MWWQGTQLELRRGPLEYARLVATLWATSHSMFVTLSYCLSFFGVGPYYSVSTGFSNGALAIAFGLARPADDHPHAHMACFAGGCGHSVLFALNTVMCYELPGGIAHIFGFVSSHAPLICTPSSS